MNFVYNTKLCEFGCGIVKLCRVEKKVKGLEVMWQKKVWNWKSFPWKSLAQKLALCSWMSLE